MHVDVKKIFAVFLQGRQRTHVWMWEHSCPPPPTGEGEGACLSVDVGAFAASNTDGGRGRMFSCECRRICTSLIRGEEDVYVDMWM